jgi:hypothetical protein
MTKRIPRIVDKIRLTPGQLRAVAELRFGDAQCLVNSAESQRANGAIYIAGFVIECLLKALLLDRYPNLRSPVDPVKLSPRDREIFDLLYSHELDVMIGFLPDIKPKFMAVSVWKEFNDIRAEWTIYVRYSPTQEKVDRAKQYLATVKEAKKWLKAL